MLDGAAALLRDFPGLRIRIVTRTYNSRAYERALALARLRAKVVQTHLMKRGVRADRIDLVETERDRPLEKWHGSEGERLSRHIDFEIV